MGRAAILVLIGALTSCAKRPPMFFGERMPAGCSGSQVNSERCVGWILDRMLMTMAFQPYQDAAITSYVTAVGNRLVRASGDRRRWTFRVLDSTEVQAYAGLTTTVYVNRGALALLRDEAELAGVIGHEIGHVLGGHARENFYAAGRDVSRSTLERSHETRYARDDELQADELAVLLLTRAGYDARGVERMLRAYAATSPTDGEHASDHHPRWTERLARVQALAALHPGGERAERAFRARMAKLVVGDDPRNAAIVGTSAVFAHAGFALELPAHQRAAAEAGIVSLELDETISIDLRVLNAAIVATFPAPTGDIASETVIRGSIALAISVRGPHAAAIARRLRASIRAPHPDELRQLRPQLVDLDAPRVLWLP